jgi:hypothetical protein
MATPKEVSWQVYWEAWARCKEKSFKLSKKAGREYEFTYWFSTASIPCSGGVTKAWYKNEMYRINHFTTIPCDSYCKEKLPTATCFARIDNKHYICHHKVGNCPWKEYS